MYSAKEGIIIWYLLHCQNQNAGEVLSSCRQRLSKEVLKDAFVLTYDQMKRYEGAWHTEQKLLFPEYVFLESEDEQRLTEELRQYKDLNQILPSESRLQRVNQEDEKFLMLLCGKNHHLAMSRGVITKGVTHVTEGPLKGMENRIRKIDRHKRLARVEIPMNNTGNYIPAGLEIVEKN